MSKKPARRKPIPQRTCVACRTVRPKRELIRIVCTPEGDVVVDAQGKRNGRGAYICAQQICWDAALTRQRLGPALRTSLDETAAAALKAYARTLPERLATIDPCQGEPAGC